MSGFARNDNPKDMPHLGSLLGLSREVNWNPGVVPSSEYRGDSSPTSPSRPQGQRTSLRLEMGFSQNRETPRMVRLPLNPTKKYLKRRQPQMSQGQNMLFLQKGRGKSVWCLWDI